MFDRHKTPGIVLKKGDRGAADQVILLLTKNFGKVEILARGIRKIRAKLRSRITLFSLVEIEFIQGRRYKILTDTTLIRKFLFEGVDFYRLELLGKISENLDALLPPGIHEKTLWQLVSESFEKLSDSELNRNQQWKMEKIYYDFLWRFFSLLGYKPELYHCALCHQKLLPQRLYFYPQNGGIICQSCFQNLQKKRKTEDLLEIKTDVVKLLRILVQGNRRLLYQLQSLNQSARENLEDISEFYLSFLQKS